MYTSAADAALAAVADVSIEFEALIKARQCGSQTLWAVRIESSRQVGKSATNNTVEMETESTRLACVWRRESDDQRLVLCVHGLSKLNAASVVTIHAC